MGLFKRKKCEPNLIDIEIRNLEDALIHNTDITGEEYKLQEEALRRLYEIKKTETECHALSSERKHKWIPIAEGCLKAGASIASILLILDYEKEDSIVSKAFHLIPRP